MRKLLNTLYVTNDQAFLSLENENIICKIDGKKALQVPILNIENIVCFSYLGCTPALMGKCVENQIPINFHSPNGKFLAKVCGETKGNVVLRVKQIEKFRDNGLVLARNGIASKVANTLALIKRSLHDDATLRYDQEIFNVICQLNSGVEKLYQASEIDQLIGIEGNCAHAYFSIFNKLIKNKNDVFMFKNRTKRPPLDAVNAMLSFIYSVYVNEYASALETVGLDSYIGFCHTLRSGRASLACDLVEETRCLVERFVLSLINLKIVNEKDFEKQISGAVFLNDEGRKKVITHWQEKKRKDMVHPFLKEKIQFGLLPYVQSNLLAKYVRGDISEYPVYLNKQI